MADDSPITTLLSALSAAPSAAAGLVVPDPKSKVPLAGVGSQLYGFADLLAKGLTGALHDSIPGLGPSMDEQAQRGGLASQLLHGTDHGIGLPGAEAVAEAGERAKASARDMLPPMEADTPAKRIGQGLVTGAVEMGVPMGITRLPKAAQAAAHILLPGSAGGKAGAVANGIGGLVGGAVAGGKELDDPLQGITTGVDTAPTTTPTATPTAVADPLQGISTGIPDAPPAEFDALVHRSEDEHVTWGKAAQWGAMTAGVVLGHKLLSGVMRDSVAAAREARYNRGQDLLDADATGRASGVIGPSTPRPEVPLPPTEGSPLVPEALTSLSTRMRAKFVNKNSQLDAVNDYYAGGKSTDAAEGLRGDTGTRLNEGYIGQRITAIAETGHDTHSGVSMPSPVDAWNRIGTWDDATKLRLSNAEYAADELDSRAIRAKDPSVVAGTPETRVSFGAYDDAQLQKFVDEGYADPRVAYELQEQNVRNARMVELMEGSGLISSSEAAKFKVEHPNYLPSADVRGIIRNPLQGRDYGNMSGPDAAYVPSYDLRSQHFESVIKQREENIARQNIIESALEFQRQNPNAPKMFEPRLNVAGEGVDGGRSVAYRVGGELRWVDVNNSALRNMIDMPPSAQSSMIRAMSAVSAISRSGTTQALSSIGGAFFQVKNALRTNVRVGIAARPELYTGALDKLVGNATNDMLRLHGGFDPTFFLNPVIGTAKNAYGGLLTGGIRLLDESGPLNPFRSTLKSLFGDEGYQAMIERMKISYANSTRGQMAEAGALNSVGWGATETSTSQIGSRTGRYSVLNATAPDLFLDRGYAGSVGAKAVKMNNLLQEITSWIGESAQTQHFSLNQGNKTLARRFGPDAEKQLAFYTRQSAGDIGQKGGSPVFRDYAAVSKYANVAVQDWANLTDAFGRAPGLTTMNIATVLGIPALATVYTAMLHGPDAVDHLFNELTNDQRVANLHFYIPGQAPENSPSLPYSQNERVFLAPMLQLFADMANLQAHPGDSTREWFKSGLEDLFAKHITKSTVGGMERGLASATEVMMPDAVQVGLAGLTGKRLAINPVDMLMPNDKPIDQRTLIPATSGQDPRMPNVASDNDLNAGAVTGKMFWNVLSAVFGAVGAGVHADYQAASQRYAVTHDMGDALSNGWHSYRQRSEGAFPMVRGVLWNAPEKLAQGTPLAESVRAATDAYRPLLTARSDVRNEGFTRRGGMELDAPPGASVKVPTDPTMMQLYMIASKMGQRLISAPHAPMKEVQDYQKVIASLASSGKTVEEIRVLNNQLVRQKNEALHNADEMINDGNMLLSNVIGKPVDIRKIKWDKGPEQFTSR